MFKVLVPAVGLLGLLAVAAQPASPQLEVQANPAPMGWHLSHEGSMAKLAYGVANSDQLAMMLTCAPGDPSAVVYGDLQPRSPRLMRASNTAEIDPISGDTYETLIRLQDAEVLALAQRGRMRVESATGAHTLRADAQERRAVSSFLAYCAQGHI